MAKFTLEEKFNAVQRYLNGEGGYKYIAKTMNTAYSTIQKWVFQYRNHGLEGLTNSYTKYTGQFKLDVLNYMSENKTSIYETAATFNIPAPSTILKWKQTLELMGVDALFSIKKGRPQMEKETNKSQPVEGTEEALRAEIERLRMENAYLKKVRALVQEKEKLQNKTKRK